MALPKRQHSKSRTRKKLTHNKIYAPMLVECKECHKLKIAHMVCPFCGYYGGREVIKIELKEKKREQR